MTLLFLGQTYRQPGLLGREGEGHVMPREEMGRIGRFWEIYK